MTDNIKKMIWHWEAGWLRRPEMDDNNGFCYEEPDGDLIYSGRAIHSKAAKLAVWEDAETGQEYLTFAHSPGSWTKEYRRMWGAFACRTLQKRSNN